MIGGGPTVGGGYECYKTCIQVVLRISFKLEWQTTIFKYTHYRGNKDNTILFLYNTMISICDFKLMC